MMLLFLFNPFFLDPCALAATVTEEIQLGTTYFTGFIEDDSINVW